MVTPLVIALDDDELIGTGSGDFRKPHPASGRFAEGVMVHAPFIRRRAEADDLRQALWIILPFALNRHPYNFVSACARRRDAFEAEPDGMFRDVRRQQVFRFDDALCRDGQQPVGERPFLPFGVALGGKPEIRRLRAGRRLQYRAR